MLFLEIITLALMAQINIFYNFSSVWTSEESSRDHHVNVKWIDMWWWELISKGIKRIIWWIGGSYYCEYMCYELTHPALGINSVVVLTRNWQTAWWHLLYILEGCGNSQMCYYLEFWVENMLRRRLFVSGTASVFLSHVQYWIYYLVNWCCSSTS